MAVQNKSPVKYSDHYWTDLSTKTEKKLGLPAGLLNSIVNNGERSNNNAVSEKGARTVYQITPSTRKLIVDKYGIDPYLSPDNAAESAGLLLQESLKRNNNDVKTAIAEYHGGVKKENHGPKTSAYVQRVLSGLTSPDEQAINELGAGFGEWLKNNPINTDLNPVQRGNGTELPQQEANRTEDINDPLSVGFGEFLKSNPAPVDQNKVVTNGQPQVSQEPETTASGVLGAITRGVAPIATGAGAGAAAGSLIGGVGAIPGALAGAGAVAIGDPLMAGLNSLLGTNYPNATDAVNLLLDKLGIAKPQSEAEKLVQSTTRGATDALGVAGLGSTIANVAKGPVARAVGTTLAEQPLTQAIVGGGAGAGSEYAQQEGAGPVGQLIGGVAGGALAHRLTPGGVLPVATQRQTSQELNDLTRKAAASGIGKGSATEKLAEKVAVDQETVDAAKRLGIEDYLQPDHITTNQAFREISQAAKSIPGSEARSIEMRNLEEIGQRANQLIDELGGSKDISQISSNVKDRFSKILSDSYEEEEKLYGQLADAIPETTRSPVPNTMSWLDERINKLGGTDNLSSKEKDVLQAFRKEEPTYALLDQVRKDVGDGLKGKGPFKDSSSSVLKPLYSSLLEDQGLVAKQFGVGDTFDLARKTVQTRKAVENDMAAIFGKTLDSSLVGKLDSSISGMAKGARSDSKPFINLIKAVPEDMRKEVTASGLTTAFGKATKNGDLNFNSYANWYEGLKNNKQGYTALMSNLPEGSAKKLDDLYKVSNGIRMSSRERIENGRIVEASKGLQGADTLISRMFDATKGGLKGLLIEPLTSAIGMHGSGVMAGIASSLIKNKDPVIQSVDRLIASQEFMSAVKKAARGQNESAAKQLSESSSFKKFFRQIKEGRTDGRQWILNSLNATGTSNFNKE